MHVSIFLAVAAAREVRHWLFRLGGVGLILVGLIDNSFIPLPGSQDVFTIILSGRDHKLWPYYVLMAVIGSVLGGYLTYRIGQKGGKEMLEKRIGEDRAQKVYKKFETAGFTSLVVGVLLPPPFPVFPLLVAAGALQYPTKKFFGAVALGRAVRFTIDAMLGILFGRAIIGFFSQYYKPALYVLISLGVLGGIGALIYYKKWKQKKGHRQSATPQPKVA
jgi:membrane protein YqaA with SNARE-associated domain